MRKTIFKLGSRLLLIGCIVFIFNPLANASPISFDLEIANPSVAIFRITNTSASAEMTGLALSIGDTDYNFDIVSGFSSLIDSGSNLTPAIIAGDDIQGADGDQTGRFDTISLIFSGFEPGDKFQFQTDIDEDNNNTPEDFDTILFNTGSSIDNAWMAVSFSDGLERGTINFTLTNQQSMDGKYYFSAAGETSPIPEPSTMILLGFGLLGFAGISRRKK